MDSSIVTPFSQYIDSLKSGDSRRVMIHALDSIAMFLSDGEASADSFAWHEMTRESANLVKSWMKEEYSPRTINKAFAAWRGVLKSAWRLGLMSIDECMSASDISSVKIPDMEAGRLIEDEEIKHFFSVCQEDRTIAGVRDYTMFVLMYATGARRSEIVHLNAEDFDLKKQSLVFREAKGGKTRTVFVNSDVSSILSYWISLLIPGNNNPIFTRVLKGGRLTNQRLTAAGLHDTLRCRLNESGIKHVTPHDFRRTFISKMIDNGVDLVTVAKIVGHTSVKQTMDYDRRGSLPARSALMSLPT